MAIVKNIPHSVAAPGLDYNVNLKTQKWYGDDTTPNSANGVKAWIAEGNALTKKTPTASTVHGASQYGINSPYYNVGANNDLLSKYTKPEVQSAVRDYVASKQNTTPANNNNNVNVTDVNLGNDTNVNPSGNVNPVDYVGVPNQNMDYMNQLSAMLQAQQAQQQAALQANQQAHQELIEQAYQNNLNNLNSAYGLTANNLGNTLNGTLGQLEQNYAYSQEQLNQNAANALREAYINRMMAEKNLEQRLNAQGLNGGAAESVIASLLNNYGSARNSIETQRMNDLADLLNTYQNNANSARSQYNDAMNSLASQNYGYQRQLQNDLANGVIGTYDDLYGALNSGYNTYANAMQNLASNQVNNAADLAAANYRNYLNAFNKGAASGATTGAGNSANTANGDSSIYSSILNSGRSVNEMLLELAKYMSQGEAVQYLRSAGYNI